jgi:hypothetical protein
MVRLFACVRVCGQLTLGTPERPQRQFDPFARLIHTYSQRAMFV